MPRGQVPMVKGHERARTKTGRWRKLRSDKGVSKKMPLPTVTVITPHMPVRLALLAQRCVPSVKAQDYPGRIEHVIVCDGDDLGSRAWCRSQGLAYTFPPPQGPGRHWGAVQRRHGIARSTGEVICYLDDDDSLYPDHVSILVALLQDNPLAQWAYAAVDWHRSRDVRYTWHNPPDPQNVSSILAHRRSLPAPWRDGPREDWDLVSTWLSHGVPYATDSRVTADAYSDE